MLELISPRGAGPRFLDPPCPTLDEAVDHVLATPDAEVRTELKRMCTIDRPYTPWLRRLADRDRDAWRLLITALRTGYTTVLAETWPSLQAGFHATSAGGRISLPAMGYTPCSRV